MQNIENQRARPTLRTLWHDPKVRGLIIQGLVAGVVLGFVWMIAHNTAVNLAKRGIASGFGFLGQPAGFDIPITFIPFGKDGTHGDVFVIGALNTLFVSAIGIVIATVLGTLIGVGRLSSNWLVSRMCTAYVELIRNVPLLLQVLFWYSGVFLSLPKVRQSMTIGDRIFINNRGIEIPTPVLEPAAIFILGAFMIGGASSVIFYYWNRNRRRQTGEYIPFGRVALGLLIGLPLAAAIVTGFPWTWDVPAFQRFNFRGGATIHLSVMALLLALSTYTAAFIAEIVRAGILSVPKGQTEAARALGLKPGRTLVQIILPQALRVIIPPMTSQYLNLAKNSSLAVAATYPDIVNVFAGTTLNQTGQAIEVILMTMAFYVTISLTISVAMNVYNHRVALRGGHR